MVLLDDLQRFRQHAFNRDECAKDLEQIRTIDISIASNITDFELNIYKNLIPHSADDLDLCTMLQVMLTGKNTSELFGILFVNFKIAENLCCPSNIK